MGEIKQNHAVSLKKGSYMIIDGRAYVVRDNQTSRPGKHGHAKCRIVAVGIIDDQKKIVVLPGHDNVQVPIIEKKTAQVLSVSGDTANVMDSESYETFDIKIPKDLKSEVKEGKQVSYWVVLNDKLIKQVK